MYRLLKRLTIAAAVLLAACAAHKHARVPAPVEVARTAAPIVSAAPPAAKRPAKPNAEKNHASPSVQSKTALPARDAGYYLDVLQGRLQQRLDPAVIVGRERGSIVLDLSRRLGFAADSAQLDDADRALLQPLAKVLDEYRATLVSVRVSADSDAVLARKLAQQRANGIVRLLTDSGIATDRIVALVPSAAARDGGAHVEIVLAPETRGD
jgi:outer membrane protein OmpA-like peptidoglycan-associated protein